MKGVTVNTTEAMSSNVVSDMVDFLSYAGKMGHLDE